jgi:hypothetical protein
MDHTANLKLPYILPDQAQKHVTHNQALSTLDTVAQLAVISLDPSIPPSTPIDGDQYIVAPSAGNEWSAQDGNIAQWLDNNWLFITPRTGWLAWITDRSSLYFYNGTDWSKYQPQTPDSVAKFGINATADDTNKLSVSADATLFNHNGSDHQLKINKKTGADTASLLFQAGFSGRAEMGLTGDNQFHIKVSPNGSSWTDAVSIDQSSGALTAKSFLSQTIQINNDAMQSISPPSTGGLIILTITHSDYPQSTNSGILAYDTGLTPALSTLALANGVTNQNTLLLDGTTGPDGKTNIAVRTGFIDIENRVGANWIYSLAFIC